MRLKKARSFLLTQSKSSSVANETHFRRLFFKNTFKTSGKIFSTRKKNVPSKKVGNDSIGWKKNSLLLKIMLNHELGQNFEQWTSVELIQMCHKLQSSDPRGAILLLLIHTFRNSLETNWLIQCRSRQVVKALQWAQLACYALLSMMAIDTRGVIEERIAVTIAR